jgi:hypothetical protein
MVAPPPDLFGEREEEIMSAGLLSDEQKAKIEEITRSDLTGRFGRVLTFPRVTVVTKTDQFDDPYVHIRIVYAGDGDALDPSWLNGFNRRNRAAFHQCGVTGIVSQSYVEESEDIELSEMMSAEARHGEGE